jgi:cytochrome c peroxidase
VATEDTEATSKTEQAVSDHHKKCKPKKDKGYDDLKIRQLEKFKNPDGHHATYSTATVNNRLDTDNPFFQVLGTNGRACVTCHTPENAWSFSAESARERFEDSCGEDPLFRTVDGSNNPNADVSDLDAKRSAYSLLLDKGLIRINRAIPAGAQFELVGVEDPYGNSTAGGISVFRRPAPSTNLKFIPTVMWDIREPNLASQAQNATLGHAQASAPLSTDVLNQIVAFETSLFTTQVQAKHVGSTSADGALGDPFYLTTVPFVPNGNRFPPGGTGFNENTITIYDAWATSDRNHRASVARGQALFNFREANDPFVTANAPPGTNPIVTCTTCHNSAQVGSFTGTALSPTAFGGFANVRISTPEFRTADLPLYKFRALVTNPFPPIPAGTILYSTDPGIAMTTGKLRDWNRFKAPPMRALSARAPYFHNGSAKDLEAVVDHYNEIIPFNFTDQEKADLVAFLKTM